LYQGERYSPGSEFDNVITINGFSKTYAMTGWRLGYVTAPREIIDGMIKILPAVRHLCDSFRPIRCD